MANNNYGHGTAGFGSNYEPHGRGESPNSDPQLADWEQARLDAEYTLHPETRNKYGNSPNPNWHTVATGGWGSEWL